MLRWLSRLPLRLVPIALLLGTGLTTALVTLAWYDYMDQELDEFRAQMHLTLETISQRANASDEGIHALTTLFKASTRVDADQFRLFAEDLLARHDFIQTVLYLPVVADGARIEFESRMHDDGYVTFAIRERQGARYVTAPRRSRYFPVLYQEPMEPSTVGRIGFDMLSMPASEWSILRAIDMSTAVASPPTQLDRHTAGYFLFKANYAGMVTPSEVSERRRAVNGIVAIGINAEKLVAGISSAEQLELSMNLHGVTTDGTAEHLVDFQGADARAAASGALGWLDDTGTVRLASQSLTITMRKPVYWAMAKFGIIVIALLVGLFLTTLLVAMAGILASRAQELQRRNTEIEQLVTRKTQELALEKDRAQVTLESIGDAVITTDANGYIEYLNTVAENLTGWDALQAVGQPLSSVFNIISEISREAMGNPVELCLREGHVVSFAEQTILIRPAGNEFAVDHTAAPIYDREGHVIGAVLVFRDVSQARSMVKKMAYQATHDVLTNLPNRVLLIDRLDQALSRAQWHRRIVAVLFMDLDRFKVINDTLGHNIGDKLLCRVAKRLTGCVRDGDTVCRLGGDEFVIVLTDVANAGDVERVVQNLVSALNEPMNLEGKELFITTSVGVALFPDHGADSGVLMKNADAAMYRAKASGKGSYLFYREDMTLQAPRQLELEADLRRAISRNELFLQYQPQLDLDTGQIFGAEALLRWRHPELGLVPPVDFIPLAEESNMILIIGEWVLAEACRQVRLWQEQGLPPIRISVNVSSRQLQGDTLVSDVRRVLERTGVAAEQLELELTESSLVQDVEAVISTFDQLKQMGVKISIDDFGTGYSSLSYLKRFPINSVKIDRGFVKDIPDDEDDKAISTAIIAMAHKLKLTVVAEGVETDAQMQFLRDNACDYIQGYYFSRPLDADRLTDLVTRTASGCAPRQAGVPRAG